MEIFSDFGAVVYLIIIIVSLFGTILFAWWWYETRKASEVYVYMMFFLIFICYEYIINIYVRYKFLSDPIDFRDMSLLKHPVFFMRSIPILIILILIVLRMTRRAYRAIKISKYDIKSAIKRNCFADLCDKFNATCIEMKLIMRRAEIDFTEEKIEAACAKALELYASTKKLEVAIEVFCKEINCATDDAQ